MVAHRVVRVVFEWRGCGCHCFRVVSVAGAVSALLRARRPLVLAVLPLLVPEDLLYLFCGYSELCDCRVRVDVEFS